MFRSVSWFVLVTVLCASSAIGAEPKTGDPQLDVILSAGAIWRKHYTAFPPRLTAEAASQAGLATDVASRTKALAGRYMSGLDTPPPPDGWSKADFDDSDWQVGPAAEFTTGDSRMSASDDLVYARGTDSGPREVGLISIRGKFLVPDTGAVKGMTLSLTYRGGFVAYINGQQIARASIAPGPVLADTPGQAYGLDAFLAPPNAKGKRAPLHWWNHRKPMHMPYWAKRERKFGPVEIDSACLRQGLNVLAIEFHRSEYPAQCMDKKTGLCFSTVGCSELLLRARSGAETISTSTARPAGLQVWTLPAWSSVLTTSYASPAEKATPIRIAGARNGKFSGQAVVGSDEPIDKLTASASDLVSDGGARIAASAVSIRYGYVNPTQASDSHRWRLNGIGGRRFDMLLDSPAARIDPSLPKRRSGLIRTSMGLPAAPVAGAVVPVWVTVAVDKGAKAGTYRGKLTISTDGHKPTAVPIELTVADWALGDPDDFVSLMNIYQSPDSIARYYKVEPWSPEHWRLIERSLELMGEAGNIGLFLPLLARSQFGNAESMVTWRAKGDGTYDYDFTRLDRYVDTAMKHHRRLKFLAACVWGYECRRRKGAVPGGGLVTVVDPATGTPSDLALPPCGSSESEKLMAPLLKALRSRLADKGLDKLLLLGLPSDGGPSAEQVAMFRRIWPGVRWIRESHYNVWSFRYDAEDRKAVVPVAYNSIVWGGGVPDPASKRLYGWRYNADHIIMTFNRAGASALNLHGFASPWRFRMWMASTLAGGRNGNGRVGADYWRLGVRVAATGRVSSEAKGGSGGTLYGSYLASSVGQVGLGNSTTDLLAPGPDGPTATARFVNALEGNQEAEARIFIEKALLDKERPLPEGLARQCQTLLDRRTNALRMNNISAALASQNWRSLTARLYALAGEVATTKPD